MRKLIQIRGWLQAGLCKQFIFYKHLRFWTWAMEFELCSPVRFYILIQPRIVNFGFYCFSSFILSLTFLFLLSTSLSPPTPSILLCFLVLHIFFLLFPSCSLYPRSFLNAIIFFFYFIKPRFLFFFLSK